MAERIEVWRSGDCVLLVDHGGHTIAQMCLGRGFSADEAWAMAREIARRFNEFQQGTD